MGKNIFQKEMHKIISFQKQLYSYKIFLILIPHFLSNHAIYFSTIKLLVILFHFLLQIVSKLF